MPVAFFVRVLWGINMSEAFESAWLLLKMPYHITEADNYDSIARHGLLPKYPGHNFGLAEAIEDLMNEEVSREVAVAYLTATAKRLGMNTAEDLFDPRRNWIYAADEDFGAEAFRELAGYGASMRHPILLYLANEPHKWMPDHGYNTIHQRSPFPVEPKDIEIADTFEPRGEDEDEYDYEEYLFDVMMGLAR